MSLANSIRIASGYVEIGGRTNRLDGALGSLQARLNTFAARTSRIAVGLGTFSGLINGMFGVMVKDAANATEVMNKFANTFRDLTPEAEAFVQTLGGSMNRNLTRVRMQMSNFASTLRGMEFSDDMVMSMSKNLTKMAQDFASFENISINESLRRIQSIMAGSSESGDFWGVNTREAALNAEFARQGLELTVRTATERQKMQARENLLARGSNEKNASGDALRTMNTLMGTFRQFEEMMLTFREAVGKALEEPLRQVMLVILPLIKSVTKWITINPGWVRTIAAVGVAMSAAAVAMIGLSAAAVLLTPAIGILMGVAGGVVGVFGAIPAAAAIAATGLAMLASYWTMLSKSGQKALDQLGVVIGQIKADFGGIWEGMTAAMNAGRLDLAWDILYQGFVLAWTRVTRYMKETFFNTLEEMAAGSWIASKMLGDIAGDADIVRQVSSAAIQREENKLRALKIQAERAKEEAEKKKALDLAEVKKIEMEPGQGGSGSGAGGGSLNGRMGTFSPFIARMMGFQRPKETWKTEMSAEEKKAQAEAIAKAAKDEEKLKELRTHSDLLKSIEKTFGQFGVI